MNPFCRLVILVIFLISIYPMKVGAQEPLDGPSRQFTGRRQVLVLSGTNKIRVGISISEVVLRTD